MKPKAPRPRKDVGELSFQLEWGHPSSPLTRVGVGVGASGVTVWEKTGPGPQDEWGREYAWPVWWTEGRLPAGAPADLSARIDAVAERFGRSRPTPIPRR